MGNLYSFEEANEIMEDAGLGRFNRADSGQNYRQFIERGSSFHIKTKRGDNFILYSTQKDYGKDVCTTVKGEIYYGKIWSKFYRRLCC